jgi:hypothetical protein
VSRLWRNIQGSSLVEFTLVFPVLILVALGTVDVTFMLFDWAQANKAVYVGARLAIVSPPVATGITNLAYTDAQRLLIGQACYDSATGTANGNCPSATTVCTPAATGGSCTNGFAFDDTAFTNAGDATKPARIFDVMKQVFPRLQRQNVQITYQTNGLGFSGRPPDLGGLPMNVTVSIRCMTFRFYFLGALMAWTFPALPNTCPAAPAGPSMPQFATTLPSESMGSIPPPPS